VHEYLQASDIFILPTENEAFGISLIEAMACGLLVISTTVGGIRDILEHRKNGIVIEKGNYQQLFNTLDMLISDTSKWAYLGKAARRTIQNKYAAEIIFKEHVELFKSLTKKSFANTTLVA
jgi:glycosyltransferase involved in cell wall biosynthesis